MAIPKAGPEPLSELEKFLAPFSRLVHRAESRHALERYATGLLSDLQRKTASDMGRSLPGTNSQRLQEFLTRTEWDWREMDRLRIRHMLAHASVEGGVLVIDDTGVAKKGTSSVGVARQYSGTLGRVDNCQVLVTTHYVDAVFDWPVSARIYLPEAWAGDRPRRRAVRVPEEIEFRTKGEIALDLVDEALAGGVRPKAVVGDARYGDQPPLLDGLEERELAYVMSLSPTVRFRPAAAVEAELAGGVRVAPPGGQPWRKKHTLEGRLPSQPAQSILGELPEEAWQKVAWREGSKGALVKEFSRVRVYRAGREGRHVPSAGWLIGERPLSGHRGERREYFLWGLDEQPLEEQVRTARVRWVIERFYQDAKGELGLDDYEGRLWQGLHRHVALVMLAHSYLTLQQSYGEEVFHPPPVAAEEGAGKPPRRSFPPGGTEKHRRAATNSA